jgi:putative ABC transport system ATP-binding protein
MNSPLVVRVEDVHRSFGSGASAAQVLRGVHLDVPPSQLVALYGPSGSGKTTLLNLIGALDRPNKGGIQVCGQDILRMSEGKRTKLRSKQMGFIFQNSTLMPTYTALENIDIALRLAGGWFWQRRRRAKQTLEIVGLSAWSSHMPEELSGGQRQRVAIARALASQPSLVLADEPTSGLDMRMARRILTLFREIAQQRGTAFLIVSHDPMVTEYVDRAYDLNDGKLVLREKQAPPIEPPHPVMETEQI